METLILKENSPQIREAIKQHGIEVCSCCEYTDSLWLNYNHSVTNVVHGKGYSEDWEKLTPQQELQRFLEEVKDPVFCVDVNDFIVNILKQRGKEVNPDIVHAHNIVMSEAYDRPTYEEVMHCMEQMIEYKNSQFNKQKQILIEGAERYLKYKFVKDVSVLNEKEHLLLILILQLTILLNT